MHTINVGLSIKRPNIGISDYCCISLQIRMLVECVVINICVWDFHCFNIASCNLSGIWRYNKSCEKCVCCVNCSCAIVCRPVNSCSDGRSSRSVNLGRQGTKTQCSRSRVTINMQLQINPVESCTNRVAKIISGHRRVCWVSLKVLQPYFLNWCWIWIRIDFDSESIVCLNLIIS